MTLPALETPRLSLEPLSRSHADALYAIYREPEVRRCLITCPSDRAEFDEVLERALAFRETHGMWAAVDRETSETVGRIGFFAFGERAEPEIAFLLSRRFWGRGLATEAAAACLTFGFNRRGWAEVIAIVRPANDAAIRVLSKLGMRRDREISLGCAPAAVHRVGALDFLGRCTRR